MVSAALALSAMTGPRLSAAHAERNPEEQRQLEELIRYRPGAGSTGKGQEPGSPAVRAR